MSAAYHTGKDEKNRCEHTALPTFQILPEPLSTAGIGIQQSH